MNSENALALPTHFHYSLESNSSINFITCNFQFIMVYYYISPPGCFLIRVKYLLINIYLNMEFKSILLILIN
jgi:hypothetical protein